MYHSMAVSTLTFDVIKDTHCNYCEGRINHEEETIISNDLVRNAIYRRKPILREIATYDCTEILTYTCSLCS
jgi:hypothetical protein